MFYFIIGSFVLIVIIIVIFMQFKISLLSEIKSAKEVTGLLERQIGELKKEFTEKMNFTASEMSRRLDTTSQMITTVQKNLGELSQATRELSEAAKEMKKLEDVLKAPKPRGGMGELMLENLLSQILPKEYYFLQYRFKNNVVDAVIRLGDGLVPVDSKFPLENFKKLIDAENDAERRIQKKKFVQDVKRHIDDIAQKYILPDEGTYDFALMYIPAENVYYEVIIKEEKDEDLLHYSLSKKVIPVSPNSFYAYLQAIVLGLRGMRIEKRASEIIKGLSRLYGDLEKFREDFEVLGKHILNAKTKYEEASRKLSRFEDKLKGMEESPKLPTG